MRWNSKAINIDFHIAICSGLHSEISKLVLKQFEIHSRKPTTLCAINIQLHRQEYQWHPTNRSIVIVP